MCFNISLNKTKDLLMELKGRSIEETEAQRENNKTYGT